MLILTRSVISSLLEMDKVIAAVEQAHCELATGQGAELRPASVAVPSSSALLVPMVAALSGGAGTAKLLTDTPDNARLSLPVQRSTIMFINTVNGMCEAILDGAAITRCRTAAASAVATKHLSREDSSALGFIGAGVLARSHFLAIKLVRPIQQVVVWSRHRSTATTFAEQVSGQVEQVRVAASPQEVVAASDILCTLTPSPTPVIRGEWLQPGLHVNAVGSPPRPDHREVDAEGIRRSRVIVDSFDLAAHESGNVLMALAEGAISKEHFRDELGQVITGQRVGRSSPEEITLYNSVGLAVQDVAAVRLVMAAARDRGLGIQVDLAS